MGPGPVAHGPLRSQGWVCPGLGVEPWAPPVLEIRQRAQRRKGGCRCEPWLWAGPRTRTDALQGRVDGAPDAHTPLPQPLPDGELQVQQGDALQDQQDEERDHKGACMGRRQRWGQGAVHGRPLWEHGVCRQRLRMTAQTRAWDLTATGTICHRAASHRGPAVASVRSTRQPLGMSAGVAVPDGAWGGTTASAGRWGRVRGHRSREPRVPRLTRRSRTRGSHSEPRRPAWTPASRASPPSWSHQDPRHLTKPPALVPESGSRREIVKATTGVPRLPEGPGGFPGAAPAGDGAERGPAVMRAAVVPTGLDAGQDAALWRRPDASCFRTHGGIWVPAW